MKVRLVYIVSDLEKSLQFEWMLGYLHKNYEFTLVSIGKTDTPLLDYAQSLDLNIIALDHRGKSFAWLWWKIFKILYRLKPKVVHCHLWKATLAGITAAWFVRVKKRIFTRHHGTIHYTQFTSGRKWDRICNALATHIIAVSENIRHILVEWDHANSKKIHVVHHGFNLQYFDHVPENEIEQVKSKYAMSNLQGPVVGVISRYEKWKGVNYVIEAFALIRQQYPKALLVLANASGNCQNEIKQQLSSLPEKSFVEIRFEADLRALYKVFDVFVHVPVDAQAEAFGQTYVEALALGIPSVFTISGVAAEFVKDEYNALVVPYRNAHEIVSGVKHILSDKGLAEKLIQNGKASIRQFDLKTMLSKLQVLYAS